MSSFMGEDYESIEMKWCSGCKLSSLGQKRGNTAGKLLQRLMIHCRPKAGYGLGLVNIMMLMLRMFRRGDDGKSLAISDDWSSTGG